MSLEASKKVLLVHVPQGAAKLQAVKFIVFQKIKKTKVQFLKNEKSLTACYFAAPLGTWTSNTFLEASNLTLFEARCSRE